MKEINEFLILRELYTYNCFSFLTLEEIMKKLDLPINQRNELKVVLDELVKLKFLDYDKITEKFKIDEVEVKKLEIK